MGDFHFAIFVIVSLPTDLIYYKSSKPLSKIWLFTISDSWITAKVYEFGNQNPSASDVFVIGHMMYDAAVGCGRYISARQETCIITFAAFHSVPIMAACLPPLLPIQIMDLTSHLPRGFSSLPASSAQSTAHRKHTNKYIFGCSMTGKYYSAAWS